MFDNLIANVTVVDPVGAAYLPELADILLLDLMLARDAVDTGEVVLKPCQG